MKITEHFSLDEFKQPERHGCPEVAYPAEWVPDRLTPLCTVLEAIRAFFGKPITILSGYRSPAYNTAVGGKKASQHLQGKAADITVEGVSAADVHEAILKLHKQGKIKLGGLGKYPGFTHVDVRDGQRLARWDGQRTEN